MKKVTYGFKHQRQRKKNWKTTIFFWLLLRPKIKRYQDSGVTYNMVTSPFKYSACCKVQILIGYKRKYKTWYLVNNNILFVKFLQNQHGPILLIVAIFALQHCNCSSSIWNTIPAILSFILQLYTDQSL